MTTQAKERDQPSAEGTVVAAPLTAPDEKLRCGTLQYTKAGLFVLFGWLLWGDFCFTVFETVGGPGILGLYLQDNFHVSNSLINIIFGVVPQVIAIAIGPPLSFKSDRHRSRWGRRIPFMLFTMPFLCFFAAAIGYADGIFVFLKEAMGEGTMLSPLAAGLLVIGFLVVGFTFFNEFVQNVYWYLFADVVPEAYMGRFIGLFRTVGSIASFLLNIYVMPYQLTHMRLIHVGVALLYFVGFGMMCLGVKEGEYPPPTDVTKKTTFWEKTQLYFRECFSHRIFVMYYVTTFFAAMSGLLAVQGVFGLHVDQHQLTVEAHAPGTTAVAISADGKYALSAGSDAKARLWSYGSKEIAVLKSLEGHKAAVTCAAISADGTIAASAAADGEIRVWRVPAGDPVTTLRADDQKVTSVALFRDGRTLVAGTSDGRLNIWDIAAGRLSTTLEAHTAEVNCIALSSDEKRLATGSSDKTMAIWNAGDWTKARTLATASGPIYSVCFAPSLAATTAAKATNGLGLKFGPGYFKEVFTNESLYDNAAGAHSRVVAQDAWLLSGGRDARTDEENSAIWIWDANEGTPIRKLKGHKAAVTSIQFKPELNLIISGSRDRSIRLWNPVDVSDLADDQAVRSISGYTTSVTAIACPPQGPFVLSASDQGELHSWDVDKGVSLKKGGLKASFFNIVAILLAFPTGMLVDKFRPLRVTIVATLLIGPTQIAYYFLFHDYVSMLWIDCVKIPLYCLLSAAAMPLSMQLFPKSKYGQFCAAASTIRSAVVAAGGILGAAAADWLTRGSLLTDNYRYGFLWIGGSYLLICAAWLLVYREWKKLGGDKYLAPES